MAPAIPVVVCGAHLDGLALNWQLRERGASLLERTTTAPCYRLYALAGGPPYRPGLVRSEQGAAIEVEIWSVPAPEFGSFVAGIPEVATNHALLKSYSIVGVHWGASLARFPDSLGRQMTTLLEMAAAGVVDPPLYPPYAFEDAAAAVSRAAAGGIAVR